jgi:small subunit ribosomal protein S16
MAVKIRLARFGRKKVPFYHVVATDSRSRRDSNFLEKLGYFNPLSKDDRIKVNVERISYWLGVGAIPTERVVLLLLKLGVKEVEKFKHTFIPRDKGYGSKKKGSTKGNETKVETVEQ